MPVFDRVLETDFDRPRGAPVDYRSKLLDGVQGLTYCAFHPCRPIPGEVEAIEPHAHHVRVDEYELFGTTAWAEWLQQQAFTLVGMRQLRDRLVFAAEPIHAAHVQAYEKAQRERMRLLTDGPPDPAWLDALEARLAREGD